MASANCSNSCRLSAFPHGAETAEILMVGSYWRGSGNEKNSRLGYLLFLEIYYSLLPSMFGERARGRELANKTGDEQKICDFANKPDISQ